MTYILEMKQPGINVIVSDALLTRRFEDSWETERSALKTGLLFTGCIFGRVGNAYESGKFIEQFKGSINGVKDTLPGFWRRFQDYTDTYSFPSGKDQQFQLVLSERTSGDPKFHILDSTSGLLKRTVNEETYFAGYGLGREILDDVMRDRFTSRLKVLQEYLVKERDMPIDAVRMLSPYFVCLWLSELSLTTEVSMLERYGVGGAFHFLMQKEDGEGSQGPSIYIFLSPDAAEKTLYGWLYKVAYVQGGLYIHSHDPKKTKSDLNVLFDTASRTDITDMSTDKVWKLIEEEAKALPFFQFCGFGCTDPKYRKDLGFIWKDYGQREDLLDEGGRLRSEICQEVLSDFMR